MAVILGVDPGSRKTGYGVINAVGSRLEYLDSGVISVPDANFPERLKQIADGLQQVIAGYSPQAGAVEQVFVSNNASSALKLGQARGAAVVALMQAQVPVAEYSARQIKQAVVGKGAATKEQVNYMVRLLLKLDFNPPEDAADALATAICDAHTRQTLIKMAGVTKVRQQRWR